MFNKSSEDGALISLTVLVSSERRWFSSAISLYSFSLFSKACFVESKLVRSDSFSLKALKKCNNYSFGYFSQIASQLGLCVFEVVSGSTRIFYPFCGTLHNMFYRICFSDKTVIKASETGAQSTLFSLPYSIQNMDGQFVFKVWLWKFGGFQGLD